MFTIFNRIFLSFKKVEVIGYLHQALQLSDCLEQNGLFYVCGYLLRKIFKFHDCDDCRCLLSDIEPGLDSKSVYLRLRSYAKNLSSTWLLCASDSSNEYIVQCENVFLQAFEKYQTLYGILGNIVLDIQNIPPPPICNAFPLLKFIKLFIRVRIYYVLKFKNQVLVDKNKHKKAAKLRDWRNIKNV